MSRVLNVTFRETTSGWTFELQPEGEEAMGPFTWKAPPHPRRLLQTLLGATSRLLDAKHPWRVRLCPGSLGASPDPAGMPAFAAWPHMEHPDRREHVYHRGWTLSEATVTRTFCAVRDAVAVVPAEGSTLAEQLEAELLHPVQVIAPGAELPEETVVVVEGGVDGAEATAIQDDAEAKGCPLLVWCASAPPPQVPVNEIVTLEASETPLVAWLARLIPRVLTGTQGPEEALAYAARGREVSPKECTARWLRGNFTQPWKTQATLDRHGFPERWEVTFDRTDQENELTGLLDTLVAEKTKRRVQVLFSAGPEGAGLERFQARPPLWREGSERRIAVERVELGWHDEPSLQLHRVCRELEAADVRDLARRIAERADRCGKPVYLLWLCHRVASLDGVGNTRRVTLDALRAYADALLALGRELPARARVLAHVSVQGPREALAALTSRAGDHGYAKVIAAIPRNVPEDDLRAWFDRHGLEVKDEEIARLAAGSYDDAIRKLRRHMSPSEDR